MIFLVLSGKNLAENAEAAARYRSTIDGVEIRADYLSDPGAEDWEKFFDGIDVPAILTVRRPEDGGKFTGGEGLRSEIFLKLLDRGRFAFIDLEGYSDLPAVERDAEERGLTVIRSLHDFEGVSADLTEKVLALPRNQAEIPKAAVMPKTTRELEILIDTFESLRGRRKILLGMGPVGFPTRVLAPVLGSYLTFASPGGQQVAPGLIDPESLDSVYRYHKLGPGTKVFGIIGNPILHSRSPDIHNAAYEKLGIDAVYVPFQPERAADFPPVMRKLGIRGLSVTVPFKEAAIPLCSWTEDAVRHIGACNTLVRVKGSLRGYNTDAEGFLAPLRPHFGKGFLNGRKACVIGAGGAARAVVYSLAREGADVLILNRTPERAERLAADFARVASSSGCTVHASPLGAEGARAALGYRDLVVQTTVLGMHPQEKAEPFPELEFKGTEIVCDIVYSPRETVFLRRAALAGCKIIHGDEMLLHQAVRQFSLFTGQDYPLFS